MMNVIYNPELNTLYVKGFYLADENGNACTEFPVIVGRDQFVEMHKKSDGSVVLVTKLRTRLNVLPNPHNESITYQWINDALAPLSNPLTEKNETPLSPPLWKVLAR